MMSLRGVVDKQSILASKRLLTADLSDQPSPGSEPDHLLRTRARADYFDVTVSLQFKNDWQSLALGTGYFNFEARGANYMTGVGFADLSLQKQTAEELAFSTHIEFTRGNDTSDACFYIFSQ